MSLEQTLNDTLTQAIKTKDTRTADVVRMLKTRLQERRTAKGFSGRSTTRWSSTSSAPTASRSRRPCAEYEKVGERGAAQAAQLRFEIDVLRALPAEGPGRGGGARARPGAASPRSGIADAKQVGRLVGDIMKTHKGQVEAGDVKRIAEELLKS